MCTPAISQQCENTTVEPAQNVLSFLTVLQVEDSFFTADLASLAYGFVFPNTVKSFRIFT